MTEPGMLYVVACACPLTRHIYRLLEAATDGGWKLAVVATLDGMGWLQSTDRAVPIVK